MKQAAERDEGPVPPLGDPQAKGEAQLYFSESRAHDFEAKATAKGRGFSRLIRKYAGKVTQLWGGPRRYDLSHRDKPHVDIEQGETFTAGIEDRTANRQRAAEDRATGGVRSGNKGVDPTAKPGARNVQPKPPAIQVVKPRPLTVSEPVAVTKPPIEPAPTSKPVTPAPASSSGPSGIEVIAGKLGSVVGSILHAVSIKTVGESLDRRWHPENYPDGFRYTDAIGQDWIKYNGKWVTQADLDNLV